MPTVCRLSVAPVKSLALVHPPEVFLGACGVAENRRFYLVEESGRLLNGLRCGKLAAVRPRYDPAAERLALAFPDGSTVEAPVELGARVDTDWTGRMVAGRIVEGPFGPVLSRYVGKPVQLVRAEVDGSASSHHAVSLLSQASVRELARRSGHEAPLDERRFRMLVAVDGCRPHEEDEWVGRRVALGDAVVRVIEPTARCATTTRDPRSGERDFDTLRAIKAYRGLTPRRTVDFGVYGRVERPALIRVGDLVAPE